MKDIKIIDSHVHVYPDKIAEKASANIGVFYSMNMRFDGTISTIKKIAIKSNITKCIINSVATTPEQTVSINNFISDTIKSNNELFYGLCTLHQDMTVNEITAELDRVKKLDLRGIKLHPDFQKFEIDDKIVYRIYEAAEERFPILFHTGDKRFNYSNPKRLAAVASDFPKLKIIAAHFGGWSEWEDGIKYLSDKENVRVDTSSSFYSMTVKKAEETIRAFTADRVLFGSDYPMWNPENELDFFNKLDLTDRERRLILSENAQKIFNI